MTRSPSSREYKLTYPCSATATATAEAAFGVLAYPETFVIDRQGRIVAAQRGPVDDAFMRAKVLPLLEQHS